MSAVAPGGIDIGGGTVRVCLLPRSAFAAKDELLHALLRLRADDQVQNNDILCEAVCLNARDVMDAPTAVLFPLLTLVLAAVEEEAVGSARFVALARAIRDRAAAHRAIKLRLLIALQHPSAPRAWRVRAVVRDGAYEAARARLRAQLVESRPASEEVGGHRDGNNIGDGDKDEQGRAGRALCEAAAEHVLAPTGAEQWADVQQGEHRFMSGALRHVLKHAPGVVDSVHGSHVTHKLSQLGIVKKDTGASTSVNSGNFSDGTSRLWSNHGRIIDDTARVELHAPHSPTGNRDRDVERTPTGSIRLVLPVDLVDLQSLEFWREHIYRKQGTRGFRFGYCTVFHPLRVASIERDGNETHCDQKYSSQVTEEEACKAHGEMLVHSAVIKKVFSSLSRPSLVEVQRVADGATVDTDELHMAVRPDLIVKKGDNLMQDHCVSIMFQVFNFIWRHSSSYCNAEAVPHCMSYEVLATDVQRGFLEMVPGLIALGDINWQEWYARHAREPSGEAVVNLIHSAAGAYAGGYVLGATDRHWGNMAVKDDCTLLHIDFSFILGDAPPIDAPRISVPTEMERIFRGVCKSTVNTANSGPDGGGAGHQTLSLWDAFVEATVTPYLALRRDATVVLRAACMLFPRAGFDPSRVHEFLSGKSGLALKKSDSEAGDYLRRKIFTSSAHWKTHVKRFVHDVVNPVWYHAVQNSPLPADGIMKLINRYQAESASTQKLNQQAAEARLEKYPPDTPLDIDE